MAFLPHATTKPVHPSVPSNPHDSFKYNLGYGNDFSTEALPGALPIAVNQPQSAPYNLYSESISGTSFTAPRKENQRVWLYRIRASTTQSSQSPYTSNPLFTSDFTPTAARGVPNVTLWATLALPTESTDFVDGVRTMFGAGAPSTRSGLAVHIYLCNKSMANKAFMNADGDMLIAPELGILTIQTEMGWMSVGPNEICVIPRGIKFRVQVNGPSRGYITECWSGHFELPDRGPIGANHLASARDFMYPVAAFEDKDVQYSLVSKYDGELWQAEMDHSPFDVVAWHGNYAPCKYDLNVSPHVLRSRFSLVKLTPPVRFYLALCSHRERDLGPRRSERNLCAPSPQPSSRYKCRGFLRGESAQVDGPPMEYMGPLLSQRSTRSLWPDRNCMTEIAINVKGPESPLKGGILLVPNLTPHGQDRASIEAASLMDTTKPQRIGDGEQVILIESNMMLRATKFALEAKNQLGRGKSDLVKYFDGTPEANMPRRIAELRQAKAPGAGSKASKI
ncbi:hypothetical protein HDU93_000656 [Gonapodya sp. JEL0774]|nr:hypothetical protein HDU93_000656 [Gonapodya sp. JEL0774]